MASVSQCAVYCRCPWTSLGDQVCIVGDSENLANWDPSGAVQLQTSSDTFPEWKGSIEVPADAENLEFKFIIRLSNGGVRWEQLSDGSNRCAKLPPGRRRGTLRATFDEETSLKVHWDEKSEEQSPRPDLSISDAWMGNELQFLRSHSTAFREGRLASVHFARTCAPEELAGDCSAIRRILKEEESATSSYHKKLELVSSLLCDLSPIFAPSPTDSESPDTEECVRDALWEEETAEMAAEAGEVTAAVAVYLHFIKRGIIPCHEGGGHYRPNHHSTAAKKIAKRLEELQAHASLRKDVQGGLLTLAIRKIHPLLPSYRGEFLQAEPLTRIRDIAHRNDIPQALKQELKVTLQNKLHRNAGPEDLRTAAEFRKRFRTDAGKLPADFVSEFEKFYGELVIFFNASRLLDLLTEIANERKDDPSFCQNVEEFREFEERESESRTAAAWFRTAELALKLRNALPTSGEATQLSLSADVGLERIAFVSLSSYENETLRKRPSQEDAASAEAAALGVSSLCMRLLAMGLRHCGLSGLRSEECEVVAKELDEFHSESNDCHLLALKAKAAVERSRRLCETFADLTKELWEPRVKALTAGLKIPDSEGSMYIESQIRSSIVFQVSKVASRILVQIRSFLKDPGFDAIVPGTAVGRLFFQAKLDVASLPARSDGPYVLFLETANGEEEVTPLDAHGVIGVIVGHDIPHLSHLGVRARQQSLIFAAIQSTDVADSIRPLIGHQVLFQCHQNDMKVEIADESSHVQMARCLLAAEVVARSASTERLESERYGGFDASRKPLLTVEDSDFEVPVAPSAFVLSEPNEITESNAGSKGAACAKLLLLSHYSRTNSAPKGSQFSCPWTVVLPFGTMETRMRDSNHWPQFRSLALKIASAPLDDATIDYLYREMKGFLQEAELSPSIIARIRDSITSSFPDFGRHEKPRVIIRSSANFEDLSTYSAAGLYDSVANVDIYDDTMVGEAVAQVWASLFSKRAILSRRLAGFSCTSATMAVIIQDLINPRMSFIMHTQNPLPLSEEDAASEVYIEMAMGLGEILASSSVRGSPHRFVVDKPTGRLRRILSFANFSTLLIPSKRRSNELQHVVADYEKDPFTTDDKFRDIMARRLGAVASLLEDHFGCAQDVEGVVTRDLEIFVVQSRPQPMQRRG